MDSKGQKKKGFMFIIVCKIIFIELLKECLHLLSFLLPS